MRDDFLGVACGTDAARASSRTGKPAGDIVHGFGVVQVMVHDARAATPFDDSEVGALVIANARDYAIIVMNDDGIIESWSPGAERIFGYVSGEVLGRPAVFLFVPSDVAAGAHGKELATAREQGRAEDSRWHVRKSGQLFWGNGVTMRMDGGRPGFVKIVRDETRNKLAEEQRVLLLNELNHRIRNSLTMVQAIAQQTLRGGVDPEVKEAFTSRLMALSQAHDVLVQGNWAAADLHAIVDQALGPHMGRAEVNGPPVRVNPQQAIALSLALHELCTNAVKHGALSTPSGKASVSWNVALDGNGRRSMNLLWAESGGPPVHKPQRSGFGSKLLAKSFAGQSGGVARVDFDPAGVRCVIELPLSGPDETPALGVDDVRGLPVRKADGEAQP